MQLVLSNNRVLAYGEDCFLCMGGTVICTKTGRSFQNATVAETTTPLPTDIDTVGYEFHGDLFVPCAPYGKGAGAVMVACEDCGTPKSSGVIADPEGNLNIPGKLTGAHVSDEVAKKIFGDVAPKTVNDVLLSDVVSDAVGDIKTTIRTDLGDDWLLCNGDRIPLEYEILRTELYPPNFTNSSWIGNYSAGKSIVAYVDGYFYAMETADAAKGTYTVRIYKAQYPKFDWQLVHEEIVTFTASVSNSPVIGTAKFYNNKFMLPVSHHVNSTLRYFLYEIDINKLGGAGTETQFTLPTNTKLDGHVAWYDGVYYFACLNDTEKYPYICYGDLSSTLTGIQINVSYNTSYTRTMKFMDVKHGIVYFAWAGRDYMKLGAFSTNNLPATIAVKEGSLADACGGAFGFYSDVLGTVFMGTAYENTSAKQSAYFYTYDAGTNGLVPFTLFGEGSSALVTEDFSDAFEYGSDLIIVTYFNGGIFRIRNYTTNPTMEKIVSSCGTALNNPFDTNLHTSEAVRGAEHPIFSKRIFEDSNLPTITTDGAYNYIRGR